MCNENKWRDDSCVVVLESNLFKLEREVLEFCKRCYQELRGIVLLENWKILEML